MATFSVNDSSTTSELVAVGIDFAPHQSPVPSPYVASASSQLDGNHSADQVFDGQFGFNHFWLGTNSGVDWVQLDLGSGNQATLDSYSLFVDNTNIAPKDFTMKGSNNGSSFTVLDTQTSVVWDTQTTSFFLGSTSAAYRYFRIDITANENAGSFTAIDEMYLLGTLVHTSTISTGDDAAVSESVSLTLSLAPSQSFSVFNSASTAEFSFVKQPGVDFLSVADSATTSEQFTPDVPGYVYVVSMFDALAVSESASAFPLGQRQFAGVDGVNVSDAVAVSIFAPVILLIHPETVVVGTTFTLDVSGQFFDPGAVVRFNATSLITTFLSSTHLTAAIGTGLTSAAVAVSVTVVNPDGVVSNAMAFAVLASLPESPHPYEKGATVDVVVPGSPANVWLQFDVQTYVYSDPNPPPSNDSINIIYNSAVQQTYQGGSLAGRTIQIPAANFQIQIVAVTGGNLFGFRVVDVRLTTPPNVGYYLLGNRNGADQPDPFGDGAPPHALTSDGPLAATHPSYKDAATPTIYPQIIPEVQVGLPYSYQFVFPNASGAVAWSLTSGTLPVGITLQTDGSLSGTAPAAPIATLFVITATDSLGKSATGTFMLRVFLNPVEIHGAPKTEDVFPPNLDWDFDWCFEWNSALYAVGVYRFASGPFSYSPVIKKSVDKGFTWTGGTIAVEASQRFVAYHLNGVVYMVSWLGTFGGVPTVKAYDLTAATLTDLYFGPTFTINFESPINRVFVKPDLTIVQFVTATLDFTCNIYMIVGSAASPGTPVTTLLSTDVPTFGAAGDYTAKLDAVLMDASGAFHVFWYSGTSTERSLQYCRVSPSLVPGPVVRMDPNYFGFFNHSFVPELSGLGHGFIRREQDEMVIPFVKPMAVGSSFSEHVLFVLRGAPLANPAFTVEVVDCKANKDASNEEYFSPFQEGITALQGADGSDVIFFVGADQWLAAGGVVAWMVRNPRDGTGWTFRDSYYNNVTIPFYPLGLDLGFMFYLRPILDASSPTGFRLALLAQPDAGGPAVNSAALMMVQYPEPVLDCGNPPTATVGTPFTHTLPFVGQTTPLPTPSGTPANPSATFFVATNGNDAWSGILPSPNLGSTDGPFLTLAKAQSAMRASTTNKKTSVRGGVFTLSADLTLSGPDAGTTWANFGSEVPIVDGGGSKVVRIGHLNSLTIQGLTFRNLGAGGVLLDTVSNLTIKNNTFLNSTNTAITGPSVDNLLFDSNVIDGQAPGNPPSGPGSAFAAVLLYVGPHDNKITHNLVKNCAGGGVHLETGPTDPPLINNVVDRNIFQNTCSNVVDSGAVYLFDKTHGSTGNKITNNIIDGCGGLSSSATKGIYVDSAVSNVLVSGNILRNCGEYSFQVHDGDHNVFTNNIFDLSSGGRLGLYQRDPAVTDFGMAGNIFTRNLVYSSGNFPPSLFTVDISGTAALMSASNNLYFSATAAFIPNTGIVDSSRLLADPQFTSPSTGDYSMPGGSPAFSTLGFTPMVVDQGPVSAPPPSGAFGLRISGMPILRDYQFGTGAGRNVQNLTDLTASFDPFGIAGTTTINHEWERYQTFNTTNHHFVADALQITASIPGGGGLFNGGINSGQIWTKETFQPGLGGHAVFAFEANLQIPSGVGMWPAFWCYTKDPSGVADSSEIDMFEFFIGLPNNDSTTMSSNLHGPGVGADTFSLFNGSDLYVPGFDFSAGFHLFQWVWTTTTVEKYVDGVLVRSSNFRWTSGGPGQVGVNLACGTDEPGLPGLKPTSLGEFPSAVNLEHLTVWVG